MHQKLFAAGPTGCPLPAHLALARPQAERWDNGTEGEKGEKRENEGRAFCPT